MKTQQIASTLAIAALIVLSSCQKDDVAIAPSDYGIAGQTAYDTDLTKEWQTPSSSSSSDVTFDLMFFLDLEYPDGLIRNGGDPSAVWRPAGHAPHPDPFRGQPSTIRSTLSQEHRPRNPFRPLRLEYESLTVRGKIRVAIVCGMRGDEVEAQTVTVDDEYVADPFVETVPSEQVTVG